MRVSILALLLIGSLACSRSDHFPGVTFNADPQADSMLRSWFSKHLIALNEQPLSPSTVTYRFLWLRSFDHPVAIRVDLDHRGTAVLHLKVSDGAGGYEPGRVIVDSHRRLGASDLDRIRHAVEAASFWSLPTSSERPALDGARWVFEAKKDLQYHVVQRHSPDHGPFRDLCLLFIELSGLRTEIY